jgi:ferrous iron transport protein B
VVAGRPAEVLDTPGLYSLLVGSEEERVTRRVLLEGSGDVTVHVVDAKSLARSLPLTLQLAELGRPLVVALNLMDEAERLGVRIDAAGLSARLGVDVVPVVAVQGRGVAELGVAIARASAGGGRPIQPLYPNGVGVAIGRVRDRLAGVYAVDPTALAALVLQGDPEACGLAAEAEPDGGSGALAAAREAAVGFDAPASYRVAVERQRVADALSEEAEAAATGGPGSRPWVDRLGRWLAEPLTGIPVLLGVLYLGLYKFVGEFGAGTAVDWLEGVVFETHVNPFLERTFAVLPWDALRALFVGDYGLLTLGLRYAVAIILPIVGSFFLFFSILEDSGYFPRLALLVDRTFKRLGLSGRAVIPIVLGFACDTMATMVTRTLETKRERVLSTLLLALAIPCSAQLGVIVAILAGQPLAFAVWSLVLLGVFGIVGALGARVLPGESAFFHMELPPLRRPRLGNVLTKTYTRMHWYFLEVLPLFLLASVLLWVGDLTGLFGRAVAAMAPVVGALRDYGAAGLYDLSQTGALDPIQLTVAAVTLTLFIPCVAQFLMMWKERGPKTALGMFAFVTPFAFGVGFLLNLVWRGLAG